MRIEKDVIGEVKVPEEAYYGSFTSRASSNFALSGIKVHKELIRSVIIIKRAAAVANRELGMLDKTAANAIIKAADEALGGKFDDEFILDAFQAGAGTPLHMNVNEVLANRAEEILGGKKGEYKKIHPNNHVNLSQSSNDVVPNAIRLTCLRMLNGLDKQMELLILSFKEISKKNGNVVKCGRTHLMDAVPITYGQVFGAYARAIERDRKCVLQASEYLLEIGVGGTAVGTGITAHPEFREMVVAEIAKDTKLKVTVSKDGVEATQNMNDFLVFSAALRQYAVTLNRIANDLRILSSGPDTGIAEIMLPEVEPGSSIMPGKINPSIPEAVNMLAYQVVANDQAVMLGTHAGQLELNFCTPLIAHNLLQSIELLADGSRMFREKCIDGLRIDAKRVRELFERSFAYATALNPYLGYSVVSKLVKEAHEKGVSLKSLILEKGLLTRDELEKVLSAKNTSGPALVDNKLLSAIRKRAGTGV